MTGEQFDKKTEDNLDQFLRSNQPEPKDPRPGEYQAIMGRIREEGAASHKFKFPVFKWLVPIASMAALLFILYSGIMPTVITTPNSNEDTFSYSLGVYDETNSDEVYLPVGEEYVLLAEAVAQR